MSIMTGFAILITEAVFGLYKQLHAINFGVYGSTMVGKTTLSQQLRTRGEVAQVNDRTVGIHRASRKSIKIDGESHTIRNADVGGEAIYWKDWVSDMQKRRVKYVIFMIDHRHLDNNSNLDHQLAWKFLVDIIVANNWPTGKRKKDSDYPIAVGIWGNKYDIGGKKYPLEEGQTIDKHEIFEPFKYGMRQLNEKGIPCFKYIVSAKSDPEMVYKGITTMIKDY
jgi:GTPase SAR1 family protein